MTYYATTAQAALIRKLLKSHVFTDRERAGLERRLVEGFHGTPSQAIEWLMTEGRWRKQAELAAAEKQQANLNL